MRARNIVANGRIVSKGRVLIIGGGTSSTTPTQALGVLNGVPYKTLDEVKQPIVLKEDARLEMTDLPKLTDDVYTLNIYGPAVVRPGSVSTYIISNYSILDQFTFINVKGEIKQDGALIHYKAQDTEGLGGWVVNGKNCPIRIEGEYIDDDWPEDGDYIGLGTRLFPLTCLCNGFNNCRVMHQLCPLRNIMLNNILQVVKD